MANHKSAVKRHKQSLKRKARNRSAKAEYRSTMKEALSLKVAGNQSGASEKARKAESLIASAVKKGIINKKTARRNISRMAKKVAKAK